MWTHQDSLWEVHQVLSILQSPHHSPHSQCMWLSRLSRLSRLLSNRRLEQLEDFTLGTPSDHHLAAVALTDLTTWIDNLSFRTELYTRMEAVHEATVIKLASNSRLSNLSMSIQVRKSCVRNSNQLSPFAQKTYNLAPARLARLRSPVMKSRQRNRAGVFCGPFDSAFWQVAELWHPNLQI